MTSYTSAEELAEAHATLVETFRSGKTKSVAWRKWQLKQAFWMIQDSTEAIAEALRQDLNRHTFESYFADIAGSLRDILHHLANVEQWSADQIPSAGLLFRALSPRIRQEPRGVALIIAPWNFPAILLISPLIAAISAGNCVMLKPSEVAENVQHLMVELVPKYLDDSAIRVVTGAIPETTRLLEMQFDMLFYTGSPTGGRIISAAAAKNLTPAVLELGGQSPVIVTASADVDLAAKRVALSKYTNAGQICLASNHVFCEPNVADVFVQKLSQYLTDFLSKTGKNDLVRIVSDKHFDRLSGLLSTTSGTITHGGQTSKLERFIEPTIITEVNMSDSLLSQEIFGPLLPILQADYRRACEIIRSGEHPLGLYIFSSNQTEIDYILAHTQSGGVTINDCMLHAAIPDSPFGGVGNSGHGAYHGKYGFDAFTHRRTVARVPAWLDYVIGFRYPPYDEKHIEKLKIGNPGFKRGESIEDQAVGPRVKSRIRNVLGKFVGWFALAVLLALVDAKMGGQPALFKGLAQGCAKTRLLVARG